MWLACAMFKVKVLQNCLLFLPQADLVTLSLFSSLLTVAGRDHEWAASPLQPKQSTVKAEARLRTGAGEFVILRNTLFRGLLSVHLFH